MADYSSPKNPAPKDDSATQQLAGELLRELRAKSAQGAVKVTITIEGQGAGGGGGRRRRRRRR